MSTGRVAAAAGIYGILAAIAWWGAASVGASPFHLARVAGGVRWVSLPVALLTGLIAGIAGIALTRWLGRVSSWGRAMTRELSTALTGVTPAAVTPLAIASAVGEEMFFRGAIQAGLVSALGLAVGVASASVLFGAMHVPWNRQLRSWTIMATAMGAFFGLLYVATGELLAPVVAHAVINRENLRYLLATRGAPVRRAPTAIGPGAVRSP